VNSTGVATASTLFSNLPNAAVQADALCLTGGSGGISPWPRSFLKQNNDGRENTNALFRRAVKLVNGNLITLPRAGRRLLRSDHLHGKPDVHPGRLQRQFGGSGFAAPANPSVATSVAADAVTILSVNWNDVNSFASPFN